MKKILLASSLLVSVSALAATPQLSNLSTSDVENVSKEFGTNFAHTAVAAPETDGVWGIEVGAVATRTQSPDFSDLVDASGGKGSDFNQIYNAAIMARAHFPFELFAELGYLPEQKISDVKIKSSSFGVGWNMGGYFSWPVDVAVGWDYGKGDVKFHQTGAGAVPTADINLTTKTSNLYVGVSKTFLFFTPYAKIGTSRIEGDLDATATIFNQAGKTKQVVNMRGGYAALGANFQFFFFKLGIEGAQMQGVKKASAKLSFDF